MARFVSLFALLLMAVPLHAQQPQTTPTAQPEILTPKPSPEPRINGAKVFGVRLGHTLLYTIAATGQRPMRFSASGLPEGVKLDEATGFLTGSVAKPGTYRVTLKAQNALGTAERELRIVVGDEILLTPLMGCNTWGGWGPTVTEANVRASAEAMVKTGLVQHGYSYINIDDGWQGHRDGKHNAIQPNEKFGDLKAFCDDLHAMGLKAGIYSTPWMTSYAGFVGGSSDSPDGSWTKPKPASRGWRHGKYTFEANDARQWAEWGFDYAKYDWGIDRPELAQRMADALRDCGRDVALELSNSAPLAQAAFFTRTANLCRTAGDLVDVWDKSQLPAAQQKWALGVRDLWILHKEWEAYNRPGHWNMPCPLRVGLLGGWDLKPLAPTRLTPDEQYSHISLWCLWSAPMIIGCPIERLDEFTMSLLTNDEVLELNQDPLGRQAHQINVPGGEALTKELEDGTKAVGLFNVGDRETTVRIRWADLGIHGKQRIRDLWRQKDLGQFEDQFEAVVRSHGVVLVRVFPATPVGK